jgi:hypothetical protein
VPHLARKRRDPLSALGYELPLPVESDYCSFTGSS